MKFFHYKRYLALDPEAGTLTRYKTEADYPLNPIETIALANIKEVWNSKKEWYMKNDHEYLSVINIIYILNRFHIKKVVINY